MGPDAVGVREQRPGMRAGRVGRPLLLLFVLAAGLRVGWVAYRFGPDGRAEQLEYPDEEAYVLSAESLASGGGLIDEFGYRATYMPGYPAFLAVFQGLPRPLLWSRLAQAFLAAWVAPATFLLAHGFARSTGCSPAAGASMSVLAGVGAACDPFLLFFSGLLLTEALFAAVLVTAWNCVFATLHEGRRARLFAVPAGVFLLAGVMLRPSAFVLVPLAAVVVWAAGRFRPPGLTRGLIVAGVAMLGLLPWGLRNQAVIGEWRWLTTRGGISLYDGLQPGAAGESDLAHTKRMAEVQGLGEVEWDRHFQHAAIAEIRREPARALRLAGRKFLRTWSLTPNVETHRQGTAAGVSLVWMVGVLATAAAGLWRFRRRAGACGVLLLPLVTFTLVHMVYVGSVRYRVPLMPMVLVLSAGGLLVSRSRCETRQPPAGSSAG